MKHRTALSLFAFFALAATTALVPTAAHAQDTVRTQQITVDGGKAEDFPIPVEFEYENGKSELTAFDNGKTSDKTDPAYGELKAVNIYGQSIKPGEEVTVVTPQGKKIRVRVDIYVWRDGDTVHVLVVVTVTVVP